VEAGLVGGLLGLPFAIVSGGIACVIGAASFALWVPSFGRYTRPGAGTVEPAPDPDVLVHQAEGEPSAAGGPTGSP
jgi:hypothetical protein